MEGVTRKEDIGTIKDLNDEIKKLEAEKEYLSGILTHSPIGIGVLKNNLITFVNDKVCEITGYTKEEFLGKNINFFLETAIDVSQIELIASKHHSIDNIFTTKSSSKIDINLSLSYFNGNNARHGYTFILSDITEKKLNDKILVKSEQLYKNLIETSPDLILILELNGYIDFVSLPESRWNFTESELLHKNFFEYLDSLSRDRFKDKIQKVIDGDISDKRFECLFIKPSGDKVFVECAIRVIGETEDSRKIFVYIRDISKHKEIEKELIASKEKAIESDRLKTAFLANMSHEIRTPMNGILGFTQMLTLPNISDDKKGYYLEIISDSSHQLLTIVDDLLEISKIETGQVKVIENEFSVKELLHELYASHKINAEKNSLEFKLELSGLTEDLYIISDLIKLKQILNNLLSNALKFTSEGFVALGCVAQKGMIEFYVKDSGIGIPREHFERIFDRFHQVDVASTRKFGGTGLGLSISKAFAKMLGGELWLESEVNNGSVFYVSIPHSPAIAFVSDVVEVGNESEPQTETNTILVVEDEDVNYIYIEELFADTDVVTLHAASGVEAVDICRQNDAINIILMDLKMPIMDGYEAFAKIREFKPDIPVIAQTAYALTEDKVKVKEAGFTDYITKPIAIDELIRVLNKYTNKEISI